MLCLPVERRLILVVTDIVQGIGTMLLLASFMSGSFQLWHLYAVSFITGLMSMFQRPAMEASVTMLVPDSHRDRANTIRQITGPTAGIIAPVITGLVYSYIGVTGVMIVDLVTFAVAVIVVNSVHIPQPAGTSGRERKSVLGEFREGLQFLFERKVLLAMMVYAAVINFLLAGPMTLSTPYIITLTGSEKTLGVLLGILNLVMFAGGVFMMIWGGTRPRIHGIMTGLLFRASWLVIYGIVRTPGMLGAALFFIFFTNALIDASLMSILQSKVPANMQGRIFALLFQMMYIATPLSLFLTGPLVDRVLEPAVGSSVWKFVSPLVGSSAGSGMGLCMAIAGICMFMLTAIMYMVPKIRTVEYDLPELSA